MWQRLMTRGPRPPQGSYPLLSMGGKDSETQIKPFYEFERRKDLDGGAVVRRVLLRHERGSPQIRRGGDDAM